MWVRSNTRKVLERYLSNPQKLHNSKIKSQKRNEIHKIKFLILEVIFWETLCYWKSQRISNSNSQINNFKRIPIEPSALTFVKLMTVRALSFHWVWKQNTVHHVYTNKLFKFNRTPPKGHPFTCFVYLRYIFDPKRVPYYVIYSLNRCYRLMFKKLSAFKALALQITFHTESLDSVLSNELIIPNDTVRQKCWKII